MFAYLQQRLYSVLLIDTIISMMLPQKKINKNNGIQSVNQYDEQKICLVTPKEETNTAIA